MKRIRLGNTIDIVWEIFLGKDKDKGKYDLTGKKLTIYLVSAFDRIKISDFTTEFNVLRFTFEGKDQKHAGRYQLTFVENEGGDNTRTLNLCDAFELVSSSCKETDDLSEITLTSSFDALRVYPIIPQVGPNGNWWVDGVDTGNPSGTAPDWNASTYKKGHIKNRTHHMQDHLCHYFKGSPIEISKPSGVGYVLLTYDTDLADKFIRIEISEVESKTHEFLDAMGMPLIFRWDADNSTINVESFAGAVEAYEMRAYYSSSAKSFDEYFVTLDEGFIPESVARKSEIATINGKPLTKGGNILIEGKNYDNEIATLQQKDAELDATKLEGEKVGTTEPTEDFEISAEIEAKLAELSSEIGNMFPSVNLLNTEDADVAVGKFLKAGGELGVSDSYVTTGFIKVEPNTLYQFFSSASVSDDARFVLFYDSARVAIGNPSASLRSKTSQENAAWLRITYYASEWGTEKAQVTRTDTSIPYQPYQPKLKEEYLPTIKVEKVGTSQIEDKAVTIDKLAIVTSANLFNPNDADIVLGYYDAGTKMVQNADYNVTGFIPVKGDKTYQLLPSDAVGTKFARFITFYDANKAYIGKIFSNVAEVVAPTNAVYMRVSYFTDTWVKAQVTEGDEPQPYEPYRLVISEDYLPTEKADLEYFFMPKDIYVASGRTIELYYSQILLNYQKYNIKAQCSIGASLERKFQIKGDDAHIGNYPLTIFVYDDNGNILKSASSTIHIMYASVSNMAILPIGDSLTNGKDWLAEVRNLSNDAVTFVGTRKTGYVANTAIRHEGRSGGTCRMYNTDGTYTYADNGYDGVGANAATFDSSKSYAVGDFCKYGDAVYVFTSAHSGAWNASHVRNISQSNPFWDWNNNKFSINHYKSFYGINYNAIMIFLGTNGISLTPETNENGALGIKTLVENIRKEDTTTPIIVVNTIYRSGQNGIGTQGNTDGYKAQSEFKFDADRKVMLLAKAVEDMIGDMENIYICPVGFTHDSQYNFGNVKKEVNPRLTDTSEVFELFPLDSVHPQLEGYLQMADEMYSTICACRVTI